MNRRVVEVTTDKNVTIRCSCRVVNKLWLGVGGACHILNLQTLKLQVTMKKIACIFVDKINYRYIINLKYNVHITI